MLGADLATGRTMGALCTYVLYSQLFLREASHKLVKFPNCHESPVAIGLENLTSLKPDLVHTEGEVWFYATKQSSAEYILLLVLVNPLSQNERAR